MPASSRADAIICLSTNGLTTGASAEPPRRLLVATVDGLRELRRAGFGQPWIADGRPTLAGRHPSSLLHLPGHDLLLAGLHYQGGILASEDGGRTWNPRCTGIESGHVYTLAAQHIGDKVVLYAGTEPAMVYRSEDLGLSWQPLAGMREVPDTDKWWFPRAVPHVKNIAFHPAEPQTLYVCVEQGDLLRSTDGGRTWRPITSYEKPGDKFRRDMHRVTFRPSDPRQIFLTTGTGLYYTADAGASWEQLASPDSRVGYPDPFFIHPDDEQTVFMAGASQNPNPEWAATGTAKPGFLVSRDGGRTWREAMQGMSQPLRGNIEAASMYRSDAGLEFFAGTACGELYTSHDGARSWTLASGDLPAMSKGPHFRHFLTPDARREVEEKLRAIGAFA